MAKLMGITPQPRYLYIIGLGDKADDSIVAQQIQTNATFNIQIERVHKVRRIQCPNQATADALWNLYGCSKIPNGYQLGNFIQSALIVRQDEFQGLITVQANPVQLPIQQQQQKQQNSSRNDYFLQQAIRKLEQTHSNAFEEKQKMLNIVLKILNTKVSEQSFQQLIDKFIGICNAIDNKTLEKSQTMEILGIFESVISIQDINVDLEIRIFCFGSLALPLPIYSRRKQFVTEKSVFTLIKSSTGSGKTTLAPLILSQFQDANLVFVTLPNKTTITSALGTIQKNIACEGVSVTRYLKAGYTGKTVILCTPLQLIKFIEKNQGIIAGSRFVLDEFHQRTVPLDVLFAQLFKNSAMLTLPHQFVMMSATPDDSILQKFNRPNIIEIPNATPYKVTVQNVEAKTVYEAAITQPGTQASQFIIQMLEGQKPHGNIIVFTSGNQNCREIEHLIQNNIKENDEIKIIDIKKEFIRRDQKIDDLYETIKSMCSDEKYKLCVLPLIMAGQASDLEKQIASNPLPREIEKKCIKVIVATNMAETSITIQNLVAMIDSGLFKEAVWDNKRGIISLEEKIISVAQRQQRIGRIGRTCAGFAILINLTVTGKENKLQAPEIERIDLKQIILDLKDVNIDLMSLNKFLPSPPKVILIQESYKYLQKLNALDAQYNITDFGKRLLQYTGINPISGYLFEKFQSVQNGANLVLIGIVSYLLTSNPIFNDYSAEILTKNYCDESDIVTAIQAFFQIYKSDEQKDLCKQSQINFKAFITVQKELSQIYQQIYQIKVGENSDDNEGVHKQIIDIYNNIPSVLQCVDKIFISQQQILNMIENGSEQLQQAQLISLCNIGSTPRYIFNGSNKLSKDNSTVLIHYFKRLGNQYFSSYNNVYFGEVSYNEAYNMYIGSMMHRIPIGQNFKKCMTVPILERAYQLPFTKQILQLSFKVGTVSQAAILQPLYIRNATDAGLDDKMTDFFTTSSDGKQIAFCLREKQQVETIEQIKQRINQSVELSVKCPDRMISLVPQLQTHIAEIFLCMQGKQQQVQSQINVKFTKIQTICAYKFDCQSVQYLLMNPNSAIVCYTVDVSWAKTEIDASLLHVEDLYGNHVFQMRKGKMCCQLVVLTQKPIPGLQQLLWKSPEVEAHFIADVDEDYKLQRLAADCVRGVNVKHDKNEILILQNGSELIIESQATPKCKSVQGCYHDDEHREQIPDDVWQANKLRIKQASDLIWQNATRDDKSSGRVKQQQEESKKRLTNQLLDRYTTRTRRTVYKLLAPLQQIYNEMMQEYIGNKIVIPCPITGFSGLQSLKLKKEQFELLRTKIESNTRQILNIPQASYVRCSIDNGLFIIQVPTLSNKQRDVRSIFMKQLAQSLEGQCVLVNYIVSFGVQNPSIDPSFEAKLNQLKQKFGYFIVEKQEKKVEDKKIYKYHNFDVRGIEAARAFYRELQEMLILETEVKIPVNILNQAIGKIPEVQAQINAILQQYKPYNKLIFNGFALVPSEGVDIKTGVVLAHQFIHELEQQAISIPIQYDSIKYGSVPLAYIQDLKKKNKKIRIEQKQNIIVVPKEDLVEIKKLINDKQQEYIEKGDSIQLGICDECKISVESVVILKDNAKICQCFCPGCVTSFMRAYGNGQMLFKTGEPFLFSSFISFMRNNQNLKDAIWSIIVRSFQISSRNQKEFRFCPNCDVLALINQDVRFRYRCSNCPLLWCSDCCEWHQQNRQCVKVTNAVKCPHCGVYVERIAACPHMHCRCGGHFCYLCGNPFDPTVIYQHINTAHPNTK